MAIRASIWGMFLKSPILNRSMFTKISNKQIRFLSSDYTQRQAGECRCLACSKQRRKIAMHRFLTRTSNECYEPSQPVKARNFFGEEIRSMMVTFGPPKLSIRRPLQSPCCQQSPPFSPPTNSAPLPNYSKLQRRKDESILCKACKKMRNVYRDYCEPSLYSGGQRCTLETKKNSIMCNWCEKIIKMCDERCPDLSYQQSRCCLRPPPQLSIECSPKLPIECCPKPPAECSPKPHIECCPAKLPKYAPPPPPPPLEPIPCPPPRHAEMCSPEPCPNTFCLAKKGPANICKHICDFDDRLPLKYSKPKCPPPSKPTSLICSAPPPKTKGVCTPPTPPKPLKTQESCPPPASKDCCQPASPLELSEICPPPMECCQPTTDCYQPPPPKCKSQPVPCQPSRHAPPPKCGLPPKPQEKCCVTPKPSGTRLCTDPASECYQLLRNKISEMLKVSQLICHDPIEQKKQSDKICQSCQDIWEMCKCDCNCGAAPIPNEVNAGKKLCTDPCGANYRELKKKICILYEVAMVCCDEPEVQMKQQEAICKGVWNIMAICDCCPKPPSGEKNSTCPPKKKSIMETVKKFALSMYQPKTACVKSYRSSCQSSIPAYSNSKTCSPKLCTDPDSANFNQMRSIAKQIYNKSAAECEKFSDQEEQHNLLCRCCQSLWKICNCGCFDPLETLPKDPCKKLCTNPTSINYERMLKTVSVLYETAMTTCKLPEQQKHQHRIMCRCIRSIMEMCGCLPEPCPGHQTECSSPTRVKCCEQQSAQMNREKKSTDASLDSFEELCKTTCLLFEASKKLCMDPSERKLLSDKILQHSCKIQELCKRIDPSDLEANSPEKNDSFGAKKNYWLSYPPKNKDCGQLRKNNRNLKTIGMKSNTNDEKSNPLNQEQIDELICESCKNIILMCDCRRNLMQSRSLSHLNTINQNSQRSFHEQQHRSVRSDASQEDLRKKDRLNRHKLKVQCSENKIKDSTNGSLFFRGRKSRSQRRCRSFSHLRHMRNKELVLKCWNKLFEVFERQSVLYRSYELNKIEYVTDPLIKKNTMYAECVQRPEYLKKMVEDYVRSPTGHNEDDEIQGSHKPLSTEKPMEYKSVIIPTKLQEDRHELNCEKKTKKVNDLDKRQCKDTVVPTSKSTEDELKQSEVKPILKEIVGTYNAETKKPLCIVLVAMKDDCGQYQKWHGEIGLVNDKEMWIENIKSRKLGRPENKNNNLKLKEVTYVPQRSIENSKSKKIIDSSNQKKDIHTSEARKSRSDKLIEKQKQKKVIEPPKKKIGLPPHTKKLIETSKYSKSELLLNSLNDISESKPKKCSSRCLQEAKVDCGQSQRNDSIISLAEVTNDRGLSKTQKRKTYVKNNEIDFKKVDRLDKMLKLDKVLSSVQKSVKNIDQGQFGFKCITKKKIPADSHNKSQQGSNDIKLPKVDDNKSVTNSKDKKIMKIVNHFKVSRSIGNTSKLNDKGSKRSVGDSHNKSGHDSEDIKPTKVVANKSITSSKDKRITKTLNDQVESRSLENTSEQNDKGAQNYHDLEEFKLPKADVDKSVTNLWDKMTKPIVKARKEARSMDDSLKLNNEVGKNRKKFSRINNSSNSNDKYGEQINVTNRTKKSDNGHGKMEINTECIRGIVQILSRKNIKTDESNNQKSKAPRFMRIRLQPKVESLKEIFGGESVLDKIKPKSTNQVILKIQSGTESKDSHGDDIKKVENECKQQITKTERKGQIQPNKECGFTKEALKSKEWFNPFESTLRAPKFEDNTSTVFRKPKTAGSKDYQSKDLNLKKSWQVENKLLTFRRPQFENNTSAISIETYKASNKPKTSGSKDNQGDLKFKKYPSWLQMVTNKKVSIVGGDHMGVACATALVSQNVTNNICVIDPYNHLKREPNAMTLLSNANILPSKDSAETKNSRVIVIATNAPAQQGDKYVDITKKSAILLRDMVPRLVQASPHAIFIVLTNPADLMTWYVKRITQLPMCRCFGAGCQLEAARFNYLISRRLNVPPSPIFGATIGQKGPTIIPVCASVGIHGIPLHSILPDTDYDEIDDTMKKVRRVVTAPTMVRHVTKRYTTWGIANSTSDIVSAILTNNNHVLSACTNAKGFHGIKDEVWLSLPCRFDHGGLSSILNFPLNNIELENLHKSASVFLNAQHNIGRKILQTEDDDGDIDIE